MGSKDEKESEEGKEYKYLPRKHSRGCSTVITRADAEPEQTLTTLCLSEKVFWNLHNINETTIFLNLKFFIRSFHHMPYNEG